MKMLILMIPVCLLGLLGGCAGDGTGLSDPSLYEKPTVAVMEFDSQAGFPLGWSIGSGMSKILEDRLLATGRFHVIEHAEAGKLIQELQLQASGVTRPQQKAELGRFKNVQYFIRGTVTDFDHVGAGESDVAVGGLGLFGARSEAVIVMTIQVIEVESREILCSRRIEKTVGTNDAAVKAVYEDISLGGRAFYRTPLGKVTQEAMGEAVRTVAQTIAAQRWRPRIAAVESDGTVAINGGANRRVQPGQEFYVLTPGQAVIDPNTGDRIGQTPGNRIARIRVAKVFPQYAIAQMVQGDIAAVSVALRCSPAEK
ncbi:MAG: CsgG/HfaB family protein [Phycisphaerae bacterium]